MKLLKNRAFAALVLIAAIALSSLYGLSKRPAVAPPEGGIPLNQDMDVSYFRKYVVDQAGVLSAGEENAIALYNANWDSLAGCILAVVTTRDAGAYGTDVEDAAWNWAATTASSSLRPARRSPPLRQRGFSMPICPVRRQALWTPTSTAA